MSLSIATMMNVMRDDFQIYASEQMNSGGAFVCSDMAHLWKILWDGSQTGKILIMYAGEETRGEFGIAAPLARVDRKFMVVVSRGRGLSLDRGDTLTENVQNARPLFEIVEEVRDICRAFQFDPNWSERPTDFGRVYAFGNPDDGRIVDAYAIEFTVGVQLEIIVDQPEDYAGLPY